MMITVALKAGDTVSSKTEWSPPDAEKVGSSVFSPKKKRKDNATMLDTGFRALDFKVSSGKP